MIETLQQTWEQELLARGEARGLEALQRALRGVVTRRFPEVSDGALDSHERIRDMAALEALIERAAVAGSLEEVERMLAEASQP